MKVAVSQELCQGHAMCHLACPEIFQLSDEDGHAIVLQETVPAHLEDTIEKVVGSCPEGAILLSD